MNNEIEFTSRAIGIYQGSFWRNRDAREILTEIKVEFSLFYDRYSKLHKNIFSVNELKEIYLDVKTTDDRVIVFCTEKMSLLEKSPWNVCESCF